MTEADRLCAQIEIWEEVSTTLDALRAGISASSLWEREQALERVQSKIENRLLMLRIRLRQAERERAKPCDPGMSDISYGDGRL